MQLTENTKKTQMYKKIHTKDSTGNEEWKEYDEKGNEIHFKNSGGFEEWKEYDNKGKLIHYKDCDGYESWLEYDEKGNEIHFKNSTGFEEWKEYDDKGNLIHYKDSDGFERWAEYDEKGNEIHYKDSNSYETWKEYDEKGNEIHFKNSDGYESWLEYDEKGKNIHSKNSKGYEEWTEYDEKGNVIHFKNSEGKEKWSTVEYVSKEQYLQEKKDLTQEEQESQMYKKIHYKNSYGNERWTDYDDKGNEIHFKDSYGYELWREYDEKGNEIHYKDSTGFEKWTEYDDKGNEIHFKDSDGDEHWKEYDDKGNVIHYKDSNGFEHWREYDEKGNVIHFKNSHGFEEWTEYDESGNAIHDKDSDGDEHWREYDEKGNVINLIHYKSSKGYESWFEYDDKGNEIHHKTSDGYEYWREYDDKGNEIYFKDSNSYETWKEYDEKGYVIHYKDSTGDEHWKKYDEKGNEIHFKSSNGYEEWTEYDEKGNIIHSKDSVGVEKWSTVEYLTKEQYMQEKNNSQIETKYTKADINDLQSFFFSYPQLSESLCYQILDDFELYQIPLFKDRDGNIYQREMNTDIAEGDESDYQLLTQDGIIDQEYNWLIDRKYTPEDEIDLQKELEDIKKFEENPKSYYKNIFKVALEKEIEKVKKEINEGNVKDVIEKNILEIAEEKVVSHAVPEEIIGWYISEDEKNYFENWKNSGDFPAYKEALDSMFAYVYEHDTSKQIKNLLIDAKEWQNAIEEWNEKKDGGDEEFFPIGNLVDVDFTNEEQIQKIIEKDNFFNTEQAKALLRMVNYDKDSFEFMFDLDNGNFVEIDKKNNKIIAVSIPRSILGYLDYEVHYRLEEEQTDSFTIEDLHDANILSELFNNIKKEPKYYEVEEARLFNGDIVFCPYIENTSAKLNRLLDKNFSTLEACEVFCRKENAFEVAKKYLTEIDSSKEYDEFQKSEFVKKFFNQLKQGWDEYDNQPPSYKELEILIKGKDAFEYGEDSLSFIRPDADAIENGFDNSWDFEEICKGYAEFADGYNKSNVICSLDDMMIFDSDFDAALQAKKDGYQFLEVGKDIIFPEEMLNDDIEYRDYIDTPENRKILNEYLREDLKMEIKENSMPVHITKMSFDKYAVDGFNDELLNKLKKTFKEQNETPLSVLYNTNEFDNGEYIITEDNKLNRFKVYFVQNDNLKQIVEDISEEICQEDIVQQIINKASSMGGYSGEYELNDLTQEEHSISVDYAFPDDLTYKKEDGNEIKITIYEEPRWNFDDNNELLNIIKEADEDYYDEIKKIIAENPSRKFDFDLGKSLRYDDYTFYNSFHIDYSKETLSQKLDNKFIVRYWTTDDTFENKLPQISNFEFAGEDSTICILNNEVTEKLNAMIRKHVKNNIDAFENYKTYRNERISKQLYTEIKQHGEPIITINEDGKTNARFQTFTISNDLHDLLELPHISWYDAKTNKSYPFEYSLYADFNLDGNSIDETKEPEIKYFEFIDDGTKEIQSADLMKRNFELLEQNQSIKEVITNTFKQVAQEYYNQNVSIELPVEQQNETTMQFTTENTKKTQMYKKIHYKTSVGYEEWREHDDKGNLIHYKDSSGDETWREYDDKGNEIYFKNSDGDEHWTEYDNKGNEIHSKDSDGNEYWKEYDDKGNKIHYKNSKGLERWTDYDEKGNPIHTKYSNGFERWTDYDEKGNKIYLKDSDGFEYWTEYDKKGNNIHYKNSEGFEHWTEYDDKGNEIYFKNSEGFEHWTEYDNKGNEIHSKDSDGNEYWKEYDDKGNKIHYKNSKGFEQWIEYDNKGNQIHSKDSEGFEHWTEYDNKGNEIHSKNSNGLEYWYEYDDKGNVIHFKDSEGFESISTIEYLTKEQYLQEKTNSTQEQESQMYKKIHTKDSDGCEEWKEYDEKGNEIHYKDSNGAEEWIEYDSNGNRIHYKNNGGYEEWYEYNSNGKEIHYKDSEGEERWYEYDSNGNKICSKDSDNLETHHEYDSNGNEIYSKNSSGYEQWYEYDSNGNKIHYKDSYGVERWYEYNSNGNEIHYKNSNGLEYWKEYDDKGNVIHYKEASGFEKWLKYDSNGNHIYSKDSNGSEKWSTVEYLTKEQYLLEKNEAVQKLNKADSLTFGQFNSDTNELKLIKEAYFKELVIDENDASKNKVILGFKENNQEQLLEMGEVEYKNLLKAFGFSKEQQENSLEINKYKTFAEEEPEVVFELIKSDYLGGTPFSDNELIGYLEGLKKSNNYHHYLDKLLFESLEQSDESLFSNVVDAGADLTWRREENDEPINILHYAAANNLNTAIKKIIEKTKTLEVDDYINLFSEENFEGQTPLEIAISNSCGQYFESTKLLIDAMADEGFSGVKDLLIEDNLGNKVLYTSKDNLDCVSILCFDGNNNIISADTESLVDEKSLGEIVSEDLIYQTNNDFLKGNIELNRSSKLISELKEVPQKLWDDEINHRILLTIPNSFAPQQSFYDFDSILALEKIKKSLFVEFDNQKESLLQGFYTKKEFIDSFSEKELNFEDFQTCDLINFFNDDYWSPVQSLKVELAALCFDKKINELFDTISPRPTAMGMCKNNDYTWLSLNINAACNNRPITEDEAEIILKYIQYEDWNFYTSVDDKVCILDVSEDFTGEGEEISTKEIVDFAYDMMVKARDLEYSIYDEKDEEVFNDLQERVGLIEEQQIESSKDEELKKQETSVVEQFFSKLKDSLYDNAKLEDVLKSAATVLQTFSDTEKKEISQYLRNKDASLGKSGNGLSSILEIKEPGQKKKRSKADDDTRGR